MRMDAAHAAEPVGVAAQAVIAQLHVTVGADRNVDNLAVTRDINGDFAIHRAADFAQELAQLVRKVGVLLNNVLIKLTEVGDH